ncbi:MAG: cell division protein FtsQ [Dysgonamonadaceae bacterium]|jgi:cell division protein FtsQ|nr:cell division protein FtsQ [Dysgonamonadaceae bacterium]
MIRKIFAILFALLLATYLLYNIFSPKKQLDEKECQDVQIVVVDTLDKCFISVERVVSILHNAHLYPKGKALKDIRTGEMEAKLEESLPVKKVHVYKTTSGVVKIKIYQRILRLRVMSAANGNYYVDSDGKIVTITEHVVAYVPIATGYVDKKFAQKELYDFALFLHDNKFWEMQIAQIYVYPNKEIELIPRVGNHRILLGKIDGFEEKLDHLLLFYKQALDKVGWNRYSKINLKYKNQIVCTKNL